jgi:hypothetical protein
MSATARTKSRCRNVPVDWTDARSGKDVVVEDLGPDVSVAGVGERPHVRRSSSTRNAIVLPSMYCIA